MGSAFSSIALCYSNNIYNQMIFRYTDEDQKLVEDLVKKRYCDKKIIQITGFNINFVRNTSAAYWKLKMKLKKDNN